MKYLLLFSAMVLGANAIAQQANIQVSGHAKTTRNMLSELESQVGHKLAVDQKLANEVLFLRIGSAPWTKVRPLIAEAVRGEWVKDGDGERLAFSKTFEFEDIAKEHESFKLGVATQTQPALQFCAKNQFDKKHLAATIERSKTIQTEMQKADPTQERLLQMEQRLLHPSWQALWKILAGIEPGRLGQITIGQTAIYALHPNNNQLSMPMVASSVLNKWYQDVQSTMAYTKGLSGTEQAYANGLWYYNQPENFHLLTNAFLRVNRVARNNFSVELRIVTEGDFQMCYAPDTLMYGTYPDQISTDPEFASQKIVASDEAKIATRRLRDAVPKNIEEGWTYCKNLELLDVFASDVLNGWSKAKGDLVAMLPDQLSFFANEWAWNDGADLAKAVAEMKVMLMSRQADGFTVMRPKNPVFARGYRTNRELLDGYINQLKTDRVPRLMPLCNYAVAQNPYAAVYSFESKWLSLNGFDCYSWESLNPLAGTSVSTRDPLRLWGMLSSTARATLMAGGTVSMGEVNGGVFGYLRNNAMGGSSDYGNRAYFQVSGSSDVTYEVNVLREKLSFDQIQIDNSQDKDGNIAILSELPIIGAITRSSNTYTDPSSTFNEQNFQQGFLKLNQITTDAVYLEQKDKLWTCYTFEQLAQMLEANAVNQKQLRFVVGKLWRGTLGLFLDGKTISQQFNYVDYLIDPKAKSITFEELPEKTKQLIATMRKRFHQDKIPPNSSGEDNNSRRTGT